MTTPKLRHDPACLLKDPDHDGPHIVAPDHPVLQNPLVYRCRKCGWAFHDPSWQDIEDHWEGGHDTRPLKDGVDTKTWAHTAENDPMGLYDDQWERRIE